MISIKFPEPRSSLWKRWRKACRKGTKVLRKKVKDGKPLKAEDFKDLYKWPSIRKRYFFNKDGPFRGKCAYCETLLANHNQDIEHYRPKNGVADEHGVPVNVDCGEGIRKHRGYYWLAYEWTNLLPACAICNRDVKGTRFPVAGKHACQDNELPLEDPLLLNPTQDIPEKHIRAKASGHLVTTNEDDGRGEMTIRVLQLNREQLVEQRKEKVKSIKYRLISAITEPETAEASKAIRELTAMKEGNGDYTAVVRAALQELAPLMLDLFKDTDSLSSRVDTSRATADGEVPGSSRDTDD